MYEFGVRAYRDELRARGPEVGVLACQVSKLRGSDEGEVSRVEEKDRPFPLLPQLFKAYLPKTAHFRIERLDNEIGDLLADPQPAESFHFHLPPLRLARFSCLRPFTVYGCNLDLLLIWKDSKLSRGACQAKNKKC
jgi:hypothetical protein